MESSESLLASILHSPPPAPPVLKPKIDIQTQVAFNGFNIISEAVEQGCSYGVHHAFKHTDAPSREYIIEQCEQAVMNQICRVLTFKDGEAQ